MNVVQVVIGALVLASAIFMLWFNTRMGRTGFGRWFGPACGFGAGVVFILRGVGVY